jgi:hypothetical protein
MKHAARVTKEILDKYTNILASRLKYRSGDVHNTELSTFEQTYCFPYYTVLSMCKYGKQYKPNNTLHCWKRQLW